MPLFWLSLATLGGIFLGANLTLPASTWLLLAALSLGFLFIPRLLSRLAVTLPGVHRPSLAQLHLRQYASRFMAQLRRLRLPVPYSLVGCFLLLGAARYQAAQPALTPEFIAWYNGQNSELILEGTLIQPPDERDRYVNLRVEVDQLHPVGDLPFTPVSGLLLARLPLGETWRYGDRVRLQGILETPFHDETFSYRDYLARQGIYSYMRPAEVDLLLRDQGNPVLAIIYGIKEAAEAIIYRLYPDPEASLLCGILLGVESGIPEHVQEAFNATGTSHIIAISGFNITIIAGLFTSLTSRTLGRWRGAVVSTVGIAIYTLLVGADAAVVRAAIMGGLTLFARQLGRRQDGLNSLAFVAALMALFNPHIPWDVGFQLSFAATLGLVLYAEPFSQAFIRIASRSLPTATTERLAGPVGEYLLFTLAAQLTTLPITIYHFGRLSLTSLVANPVILPAQPPVMVLGGLAVLLGLVYAPLGQLAAYLAWPFVLFTIRVVEIFAAIPGGSIPLGRVTAPLVAAFYLLLFTWTFAGERIQNYLKGRAIPLKPGVALLGLCILAVLTWRAAFSAPDGKMHLTILDVGSGDAILIQTPTGRYLLIDGGPSTNRLSDALGRRLPLTHRRLDWLVVASPGKDNLASLPRAVERFPPANALWAGPTHGSRASRELWEHLTVTEIPVTSAVAGQSLDLGAGARLEVLTVGQRGAVLLLAWQSFRALLPVGIDLADLESLDYGANIGPVSVLLLAESGYAPANPPGWIAALQPQVVLLSVAPDDPQGLPSPETMEALQGYTILRTDRNGWIEISTDGERMWVEVERK